MFLTSKLSDIKIYDVISFYEKDCGNITGIVSNIKRTGSKFTIDLKRGLRYGAESSHLLNLDHKIKKEFYKQRSIVTLLRTRKLNGK